LDNSIIQSLNECFDSNSGKKWDDFTYVGLASLMHQLARNWRRQGVFERADQLYQQAYPMVAQNRLAPDRGTSILQDWALLKVDLGEVPAAIELANRQAALAKETHRCYTGFEGLLRNALEFQVAFFEKLGDSNSADHFRKELNSLGTPERCDGLCVSEPRKAEDQCN
jgi:hypothetical protein